MTGQSWILLQVDRSIFKSPAWHSVTKLVNKRQRQSSYEWLLCKQLHMFSIQLDINFSKLTIFEHSVNEASFTMLQISQLLACNWYGQILKIKYVFIKYYYYFVILILFEIYCQTCGSHSGVPSITQLFPNSTVLRAWLPSGNCLSFIEYPSKYPHKPSTWCINFVEIPIFTFEFISHIIQNP